MPSNIFSTTGTNVSIIIIDKQQNTSDKVMLMNASKLGEKVKEDGKRHRKDHCPENMTVMRRIALNLLRTPEKPENKKRDSLSKRKVWFRENRKFRQSVLQHL